jgi:hypothetical protein
VRTSLDDLHAAPSHGALKAVAVWLLDCDAVRMRRIERRAASGTWRRHTPDEIAWYLDVAERMRRNAPDAVHRLDTSHPSVGEVVDQLAEQAAAKPT